VKKFASTSGAETAAEKAMAEKIKKGYHVEGDQKKIEVIDDFDAIFSEPVVSNEKNKIIKKYIKPKKKCIFKCYKSFQETKIFFRKSETVMYSVLYRFASIEFEKGKAPSRSNKGIFFDIVLDNNFDFNDQWVDGFELKISDKSLEQKVNKILKTKKLQEKIIALGFLENVKYDILVDELAGSSYEIEE